MTKISRKVMAMVLIASIMGTTIPVPAQATTIETEVALAVGQPLQERLTAFLDRAEVRAQLAAYGVSPTDVEARVAAMSDAEAAQLAAAIDELPAGGIIGAILLVFLVLLVTDILGFTKVFPFTRPIK